MFLKKYSNFLKDIVFPSLTICNLNQLELSFMKDLNAYGNMTKTNLLINEFIKGYPENHSEEEESIVNEIKDRLNLILKVNMLVMAHSI